MQLDEVWQTPFASYMREVALNPVSSWNEFEDRISRLRELHAELGTTASTLLFRGQAHECWHVESTLERKIADFPKCQEDLDYQNYLATIHSIKYRVEEHAGMKFDLKTSPQPQSHQPDFGSHYEYLVYLRHHNFPTPIVDWSRNSHVAAHFAFEDHKPYSQNVKVFIFCERPGGVKGGWAADARIIHLNRGGELHHRSGTHDLSSPNGRWALRNQTAYTNIGKHCTNESSRSSDGHPHSKDAASRFHTSPERVKARHS